MASTETASEFASNKTSTNNKTAYDLQNEIELLTKDFKGQCKVLESSGRFKKVVKLNPDGKNIVFNFKIPDGYPERQAVIEIRSENLDEDDCFDLTGYLTQVWDKNPSESFTSIVDIGLGWLKEGNINLMGERKKTNSQFLKRKQKGKNKKNKTEQADKPKKPPMKTAIDVVKRIMWDEVVDRDHCIVGYIDRLEGLKEKYFNAFSWEDIASVDYTVLAIPKHRIQYFKYRGEIVWDKRIRLDNFFGSTGSKTTIKDVIRRQDGGEAATRDHNYENNEDEDGENNRQDDVTERDDSDYYDSGEITDSESDSDDGITVTIGQGAVVHGYYGADYEDGDCDGAEGETAIYNEAKEFDNFWTDKLRPNYFVALRITDENVRKKVQSIQEHITNYEPCFKPCSMPATSLHITLCTLGLDTPEQVQNATKCLQDIKHELKSFVPKDEKLKFVGVDNFFNRVVYGKVEECPPEFYELVEHLKLCLNTQGVEIRDNHEFVPHMTLMKISRPVARATGKKYVSPWLYSCFNDTEIGYQAIDNIHLCEMGDGRQDDGFYLSAFSMEL